MEQTVTVIGGGLAGAEAGWQLARAGVRVVLFEMRPGRQTPAHVSDQLAELVCSNSLGSRLTDRATGLLQCELRELGSLIMSAAEATQVPAGGALAVDRESFAREVTARLEQHPSIEVRREEARVISTSVTTIVATGPLTSDAMAAELERLTGEEHLFFYDAMAPIVELDSLDMDVCFRGSRYGVGEKAEGDYINCPMDELEYQRFLEHLLAADTVALREFERDDPRFFEGCLPIEELAGRGRDAIRYGPLRPVGLRDARTGGQPYAVVQLRQDNLAGTLYNLVGFQTNLTWTDQERVLHLIPGLENARFVRFGQMHRNTFVCGPKVLEPSLRVRSHPNVFLAGQLTGTEGYVGSVGTGLVAGVNAARLAQGLEPVCLPEETMLGALCRYVTGAQPAGFQPMKANFGLLPPLDRRIRNKRERNAAHAERSMEALACFREAHGL